MGMVVEVGDGEERGEWEIDEVRVWAVVSKGNRSE